MIKFRPERRAVVKGAPPFGAAKRTLDCEHRSGTPLPVDGRRSGNTFPLVGLERVLFWTAGPTTAQEHTRRLITLIFAGRNRMVMIRRELPQTNFASSAEPVAYFRRGFSFVLAPAAADPVLELDSVVHVLLFLLFPYLESSCFCFSFPVMLPVVVYRLIQP